GISSVGNVATTTVCPPIQPGPRFETIDWYSAVSATTSDDVGPSVIVASGDTLMLVASTAVLLSGVVSPPPVTVTTFCPFDAPASTSTRNAITGYAAPAARLSLRWHVTVCPAIVHAHPAPDAATGVRPGGTPSVTTT